MLEVDIASKRFDSSEGVSLEVLRDLSFTCESNSFTSIVGPSGCGKTTTLRCILGLDTDFEGTVSTSQLNTGIENISAVFQEPRLLPWRTVEQNVGLVLNNPNPPELTSLFTALGLNEHRDFYPNELSLGLARRVSLARAFSVKPAVLILDEPFVSLDEETAARQRQLLMKVWSARACTALMVTHNLSEAIELSDRILLFSGSPSSVSGEFTIPIKREHRDRDTIARFKGEILELQQSLKR
ncbi:MAG: ABC transporter ATP-binding protein [Granulosicoccaceae bacterium]